MPETDVMTEPAKRIQLLTESSTIKMAKLSRELKAKGIPLINLSLGEPDFETPDHIKQAGIEAINQGYSKYPPVAGYPELREAIARKFKRDNNLDYKPSQTLVSTGAKHSIMNIVLSIVNKGDEVIIPAPYWVTYPEMVKLAEGKSVIIETTVEQNFKVTPEQLENAITERTKAFMFSSPSNPTGNFYSHTELAALAKVFERHPQIIVISDEIYEHINFVGKHVSLAQFPEIHDRIAVVNGVSKAFAMTGWRIGYMAGPQWLVDACEKLQGQFTSAACSIAQRATIAALDGTFEPTLKMCEAFTRRKELIVNKLQKVEGLRFSAPQGAFYLFPNVEYYFGRSYENFNIKNAEDLCAFLLEKAQVVCVPGDGFGSPECIRISYATSEDEIERAADQITKSLSLLK